MDEYDLANNLFGSSRLESDASATSTETVLGTAVGDSVDGIVSVVLEGDVTAIDANGSEGDNVIEMETSPAVKKGDTVLISLVGGTGMTPTVTAVVGSGDRTDATATEAADTAAKASDAAAEASEAAAKAIIETVTEYAVSETPTDVPESGWSTEAPEYKEGQYTWMRHTVTYGDGRTDTTAPALITGNDGTSVTVKSTEVSYQASDSGTDIPGGEWSDAVPTVAQGQYLWIRTVVTYSPSGSLTSYSVSYHAKDGESGEDGKMLYGTCATAAATAAKVATVTGFALESGATVSIRFTYANTAASPTLNINSLGAKKVFTNGVQYAYWAAGAAVTLVYDGTQFQVCSTPVYANTVTVGNPASQNVYIDSDSVDIRNGTVVGSSFSEDLIELGKSSSLSKIDMANGSVIISGLNDSTFTPGVTSQIYVPDRIKMIAGELDTGDTLGAVSYVDVNRDVTDSAYPSANVNISAQTKKTASTGAYTALTLRNIGTTGTAKLTAGQTSVAVQEGIVGFGAQDNSPKTTFNIDGYNRLALTQLWSGTLAKGGSITVAAFAQYNLFAVKISSNDVLLIGVKNGSYLDCVGSWDNGSSYTARASFTVSGSKFTLVAASKHIIDTSAEGTSVNVTKIYGLF